MQKEFSRTLGPIFSGLKVILLQIIGFDPEKFPLLFSNNFFTYRSLKIFYLIQLPIKSSEIRKKYNWINLILPKDHWNLVRSPDIIQNRQFQILRKLLENIFTQFLEKLTLLSKKEFHVDCKMKDSIQGEINSIKKYNYLICINSVAHKFLLIILVYAFILTQDYDIIII